MKRRFKNFLLLATICGMICACGNSKSTSQNTNNVENSINVINDEEVDSSEESLEKPIDSSIEVLPDKTDDTETEQTIADNNAYVSGILVLNKSEKALNLDIIDPDTGNVSHFRTFSYGAYCFPNMFEDYRRSTIRQWFDDDYTKLAVIFNKNNVSTGWVDINGSTTNVSEIIESSNDFGGKIHHERPCFFGGYFYYCDGSINSLKTNPNRRVPIDNINAESVETPEVGGIGKTLIRPDGSVGVYDYYDSSLSYRAGIECTDWISENECVGGYGMLYKYTLNPNQEDTWYIERKALVPDVDERVNFSGIVSPDKTKVAFLSRLTSWGDKDEGRAKLFIVSTEGGTPEVINTNYDFPALSSRGEYPVALIDWR